MLCEINETEEMRISKLIRGFREDLREKLDILQNLTFETTSSSALEYEKYPKKKINTIYRTPQVRTSPTINPTPVSKAEITKQNPKNKVLTLVNVMVLPITRMNVQCEGFHNNCVA